MPMSSDRRGRRSLQDIIKLKRNPFTGSKQHLHGWQANKKRTCAQPVVLGLCPKLKYPPFYGGIFIVIRKPRDTSPRASRGSKKAIACEQNTNKKSAQDVFVPKAPLCKGSCRANARLRD